jgi:elongation factor Tu
MELRELLSKYNYPGDDTPIIRGSALKALEGEHASTAAVDPEADGGVRLVHPGAEARDRQAVPDAGRGRVHDHGPRHGRDGPIERGIVKVGDELEIVGSATRARRRARASRCSASCSTRARRATTSACCCAAPSARRSSAAWCCARRARSAAHHFTREVYVLKKEEGGRHTPFFNGYRPQFYFRTTDVTGTVTLPAAPRW